MEKDTYNFGSEDGGISTSRLGVLKDNSLKAAGCGYLLGDVALATAKAMEGQYWGAAGAGLWGIGGLAAAWFGNPKAEKQLQLIERRLGAYLRKQGIDIPKDPTTAELNKTDGVIEHIESFLYAHPSEVLNAVYAVGGLMTLKGGLKIDTKTGTRTKSDIASGILVMAGALAGLLIPEKKPDPDHPAEGMLGKTWEWVQEKPLRLSGALYHLNNVSMILGGFEKKKAGSSSCIPRFITAASYIFANTMLIFSSKKNPGQKADLLSPLADLSARVVASQPKETQEALIQQVSGYLAAQPEVHMQSDAIAAMLHLKLLHASRTLAAVPPLWQERTGLSTGPSTGPVTPAL